MTIIVAYQTEQEVDRLLLLVHRDLARVRGNILMAQEKLDAEEEAGKPILPGSVRRSAQKTVATGPEQRAVLERAQIALREGLAEHRAR